MFPVSYSIRGINHKKEGCGAGQSSGRIKGKGVNTPSASTKRKQQS
jgi:hypothetical protein